MKNYGLKNSLATISIAAVVCLFHTEPVKAQITFGEVKEAPKEIPDWERYGRKKWSVPYDSTSFYIEKALPLIDGYKRYIGQQLFLLKVDSYDKQLIYTKPTKYNFVVNNDNREVESDVYVAENVGIEIDNNIQKIVNKYYEIIDVVPYDKYPYWQENLKYHEKKTDFKVTEFWYKDDKGDQQSVNFTDVPPCFVMKETQSGDIVYTFEPEKFILVGAFVKLKKEHIGKTIVNYVVSDNNVDLKLENKWKCTDVTFVENKPSFVLKNLDVESTEITLDCFRGGPTGPTLDTYIDLKEGRQRKGEKYWALEQEFNKYSNELLAANKATEENRLKQQNQNTAAKTQRRQALITKYGQTITTKILNQEPEIGMTKAMFDDMNIKPWIVSTQNTKTANGIAEVYVIRSGLYKCKRIVIINQKIKQIDTYNCN